PWYIRFGWWAYHLTWLPQRAALKRPDEVVTVSETTKTLIAQHRLTDRPVTVVRNAADPIDADPPARTAPATGDLVYMGSFMPYKNVGTLARAMHELPGNRLHLLSRIAPGERAALERVAPPGSLEFHAGVAVVEYAEIGRTIVCTPVTEGSRIPV